MKEVLVTREDVLAAKRAKADGMGLTTSCAMHQALEPFIREMFSVGTNFAGESFTSKRYVFTPVLSKELHEGDFEMALAKIEANGPYKFQVEGI